MTRASIREYTEAVRGRYFLASKTEKGKILGAEVVLLVETNLTSRHNVECGKRNLLSQGNDTSCCYKHLPYTIHFCIIQPVSLYSGIINGAQIVWIEIEKDDEAFLDFIDVVIDVLELPEAPGHSPSCQWCGYTAKLNSAGKY